MMRTQIRILAALLVVWLALIAVMTLSLQSEERRHVNATTHPDAEHHMASVDERTFVHTGLWAQEVEPDGTSVFVRDIRRQ